MMRKQRLMMVAGIASVAVLAAGCATSRQQRQQSSVVNYLYPQKAEPVETPTIPRLALPLRVGIAFVPEQRQHRSIPVTETKKLEMMQEVANHFRERPYVESVELIPSSYLRPQGSFANLDQIRAMFGVDVVALLSYDQTQFTDESLMSISYWTLVGAYLIPGEKNDTHTMMDAAVYDVASRKMLFRAPGISHVKGRATPIQLSEALRKDSLASLEEARVNMVANLDAELTRFKARVKEQPEQFAVVHKPGYTGGGSLGLAWLAGLLGLVVFGRGRCAAA